MKKDKYYWQGEAVDAVFKFGKAHPDKNGLIVAPVGTGKSHVIARTAKRVIDAGGRVLLITDSPKLVMQNALRCEEYTKTRCGIYCAKLKTKDVKQSIISASIYSIASALKKDINAIGKFDLVMIDECHMINLKDVGTYRRVIRQLQDGYKRPPRIIGLTATNYRLGQGYITTGYDALFDTIIYEYTVTQALLDGLWCPPVSPATVKVFDTSLLKKSGDDFTKASRKKYAGNKETTAQAVDDALRNSRDRHSTMWFAASVEQAVWIRDILSDRGIVAGLIVGDRKIAPDKYQENMLEKFERNEIKHIVNCEMLTKGYDCPRVDCGVLFFATASAAKFMQVCGRILRLYDGEDYKKYDALLLDYGGNFDRHGPLNKLQIKDKLRDRPPSGDNYLPLKTCPKCKAGKIALSARVCPFETCGYEFPVGAIRNTEAEVIDPIDFDMGGVNAKLYAVDQVYYSIHDKKRVGLNKYVPVKIPSMKVTYRCGNIDVVEWVHYDHYGELKRQAKIWHSIFSESRMVESTMANLKNHKQFAWPTVVYAYKSKSKWFPCAYGLGGDIVYKPGFFGGVANDIEEVKPATMETLFDLGSFTDTGAVNDR